MKKNYFVSYGNFGNQYSVVWSYEKSIPGYERITRKKAISLVQREREREKYDPAFSGYASRYITQFDIEFNEPEPEPDITEETDFYCVYPYIIDRKNLKFRYY